MYPLDFIEDSSVEEIYSSHSLEYYSFSECEKVLSDWYGKLSQGGVLRLSVPDFDKLVFVYLREKSNIDSIIAPVFGKWRSDNGSFIYHKSVFNSEKLMTLVKNAGFRKIVTWDPVEFFQTSNPSHDDYSLAYYPHKGLSMEYQ